MGLLSSFWRKQRGAPAEPRLDAAWVSVQEDHVSLAGGVRQFASVPGPQQRAAYVGVWGGVSLNGSVPGSGGWLCVGT